MKKTILIMALIITVAFTFCGCSNVHNTSSTDETKVSSATEAPTEPAISQIDGLSFQAKQKSYPAVQKVTIAFSNGTKDSYSYGSQYQLQAYQNNRWVHVPQSIRSGAVKKLLHMQGQPGNAVIRLPMKTAVSPPASTESSSPLRTTPRKRT